MRARLLASAAVLVSAVTHLLLWLDGVRHQSVGPAFLLNAVGGAVIAVLLLRWRHWVPPLLAVGFGASTLGAFVIAATVGLLGVHEHWTGGYVWTAAVAEVVAVAAGAVLLAREQPLRSRAQLEHRVAVRRPHLH
jgi:O-antigen/teichoic acid export membrane protein